MGLVTTTVLCALVTAGTSLGLSHGSWAGESLIEIDDIKRISLYGEHDLRLKQGDQQYVKVIADDEDLADIKAEIRGSTLSLGQARSRSWFGRSGSAATFEVQVRSIEALRHRGSGRVEMDDFEVDDELRIVIYGSGRVEADSLKAEELELFSFSSGDIRVKSASAEELEIRANASGDIRVGRIRAEELEIRNYASGDVEILGDSRVNDLEISVYASGGVEAESLNADEVYVTIYASGDVSLGESEELEISIFASGDVTYRGRPRLSVSSRGSGRARATE